MKELTALQWAKEGYVLNPDAVGEERWTNCVHVKKAIYYSEHEVHEDKEAANAIIKAKQKEYNKASKERENKYKKAMAFRENMKRNGSGFRKVGYRIRMHDGNMAKR